MPIAEWKRRELLSIRQSAIADRQYPDVALVTPQKSAPFRDIRDIWRTPAFRPPF
jgi:hypothetical protein